MTQFKHKTKRNVPTTSTWYHVFAPVGVMRTLREKFFEMYGDHCAVCGWTGEKRALTLDHIHCNGAEERRLMGTYGVYLKATEKHLPEEYRVLCCNCQVIEYKKFRDSHLKAVV